jgi:putative ABC transport system permease protein
MSLLGFIAKDACRTVLRDRGYAFTVVLTLGLTIGATTAVFSIVDGVLLKPLPFPDSHRLVAVREIWRELADRIPVLEVNERHFEYWRQHARSFDSLAQYIVLPANLSGAGDTSQILVGRTSGSFFDVLQVQAALGRTLTADDEPSARPAVTVISDVLWRQRFGSDPSIVGRSVTLDGTPHTIVGVLPAAFRVPAQRLSPNPDAFVPIHMDASRVGWEGDHNNDAIGRLRDGITVEQARAELDVLQQQVGVIATQQAGEPVTLASVVTPLTESIVGKARRGLLLLLGAVGAVLLIACANLANLSLTRAMARVRHTAIRSALGGSRARAVMHVVIEQIVLAVAGGVLGVGIAIAALQLFVRTAPIDLPRVNDVTLDLRVLAFAGATSLLAGLLVAILPAWRTSRSDASEVLRGTFVSTTTDRGGVGARSMLLALQVALSVTLLAVTGLLGASFIRLMNVDRGFVAEGVLVVPISLPANRYADEASVLTVYDRLLAAVHTIPGVAGATTISSTPLSGSGQVNGISPEGSTGPRGEQPSANFRFVAPGFFRTLGVPIVRGRPFSDADRSGTAATPALISAPTARRLWPNDDALGKRFSRGIPGEPGFEVVGIVGDAKVTSLDRTPPLMVYLPYWWRGRTSMSLLVKTTTEPTAVTPAIRRVVGDIDPAIAIGTVRPLERLVEASIGSQRYQAQLFVAFGAVALFIATLGVYAVTSYAVSRRRREMNIRVALGARTQQVRAMVVRQGMAPIVAGLAVGLAGALAVGGVVASLLFEVSARDPRILGAVAALVAFTAVIACMAAVCTSLLIEPAAALRAE